MLREKFREQFYLARFVVWSYVYDTYLVKEFALLNDSNWFKLKRNVGFGLVLFGATCYFKIIGYAFYYEGWALKNLFHMMLYCCFFPFRNDKLQGIYPMVCSSIAYETYSGHHQTHQCKTTVKDRPPGKTEHTKESNAQRKECQSRSNEGKIGSSLSQCGTYVWEDSTGARQPCTLFWKPCSCAGHFIALFGKTCPGSWKIRTQNR